MGVTITENISKTITGISYVVWWSALSKIRVRGLWGLENVNEIFWRSWTGRLHSKGAFEKRHRGSKEEKAST